DFYCNAACKFFILPQFKSNFFSHAYQLTQQKIYISCVCFKSILSGNRFCFVPGMYFAEMQSLSLVPEIAAPLAQLIFQFILRMFQNIANELNTHFFQHNKSMFANTGNFIYSKRR